MGKLNQKFAKCRLKFYPYQGLDNCGITDKFSCYSYITVLFDLSSRYTIFYSPLRCGAIIDISLQEINHLNQNILYFRGIDKYLFYTPKRNLLKGTDEGEYLEEILFGKKIDQLRILECHILLISIF